MKSHVVKVCGLEEVHASEGFVQAAVGEVLLLGKFLVMEKTHQEEVQVGATWVLIQASYQVEIVLGTFQVDLA